jgi:hypothetical protein
MQLLLPEPDSTENCRTGRPNLDWRSQPTTGIDGPVDYDSSMSRYDTFIEDGTIYVGSSEGPIAVGELADAIDAVGGPSWTITYSAELKERHPEMDTSDEGLTVDVADMINAMTHSEQFVEALQAQPAETAAEGDISPRLGLFVGKLLENLDSGVA